MRARVVDGGIGGADDVEVPQRRVPQGIVVGCRGDALIAQEPLADELRLAIRRRGALGQVLGHERDVGGAVDGRGGGEHDVVDTGIRHSGEDDARALDVLLVRVQGALHRDARVLEAGDVDDARHGVIAHRGGEQIAVEDRAAHERHALGDEPRVPAREVIDDDGGDTRRLECAHHVRPDIAGSAGHKPRRHVIHPARCARRARLDCSSQALPSASATTARASACTSARCSGPRSDSA